MDTGIIPRGSILLKSNYVNGEFDGKFESWFEDGKIEYSGQYKNDCQGWDMASSIILMELLDTKLNI